MKKTYQFLVTERLRLLDGFLFFALSCNGTGAIIEIVIAVRIGIGHFALA